MKLFLFVILLNLTSVLFSQEIKKINDLKICDMNDYTEYSVFDSVIADKRMVFLGESGHSGQEYNQSKFKIIKYLHEKHGFNTIIFESGISDCFYANINKGNNDSLWLMLHSVYPIWWSEPTLNLMDYILKSNMNIGGFDYKSSSKINSEFIKMIQIDDTLLVNETYQNDIIFSKYIDNTILNSETEQSKLDSIQTLSRLLISNYEKIKLILSMKEIDKLNDYLIKNINNKLFLLSNYENQQYLINSRDSIMSDNIKWFYDSLYPKDKIIVWAANDHISKVKSNFKDYYYAGSVLPDRIKQNSYFIGFYAFSGEMYSGTSGTFNILKPRKRSLEYRVSSYFHNHKDNFIDFSTASNIKKIKWIKRKTTSYVWGRIPVMIVPIEFYDGVVLINKLSIAK